MATELAAVRGVFDCRIQRLLRHVGRHQAEERPIGEPCQRQNARRVTNPTKHVALVHAAIIEDHLAQVSLTEAEARCFLGFEGGFFSVDDDADQTV